MVFLFIRNNILFLKFKWSIRLTMVKFKEQVLLADHIKVNRVLYEHHGIYLGKYKVIHYTENEGNITKGLVKVTSLKNFLDGATNFDVIRHQNPIFSPEEIIERAKSRIGEDNYSIFSNNCEHFCNWCIEGVAESEQVQTVITIIITGLAGLKGLFLVKAVKGFIEKPHKELEKTTTNLLNAEKELLKVSKSAIESQFILEKFVEENIKLDHKIKEQFEENKKAGKKALDAIEKFRKQI